MKIYRNLFLFMAAAGIVLYLTGCPSSSTSAPPPQISGVVSAPGNMGGSGVIASSILDQFRKKLAWLSVPSAQAIAVKGTLPVGAGVIVDLIEINNSGTQVGKPLATTTTATDGSYALTAPDGFNYSSRYVVRASNPDDPAKYLDAIASGASVDVDPGSDVTRDLIIAAASGVGLSAIAPETVAEVQDEVETLANQADTFSNIAGAKTALLAQAAADEEAANILASLASSGAISGKVTDSSGTPLRNIRIVVRDFGDWVTRAVTRTDANGAYSLHVPPGDYILGALNMTEASTAASEWWTATGGVANQFSAGKVTVATTSTNDFMLDPGVRISGKVSGVSTSLPVRGVQIQLRDFTGDQPVAGTHSAPDGSYRINVRPGNYTVGAFNTTLQPFASQLYNSMLVNGGSNASEAEKITLGAGIPRTANFYLLEGRQVSGNVSENSLALAGIAVRFYDHSGAFVRGVRSDRLGKYQLWLQPNAGGEPYIVRARGQSAKADISSTSQGAVNFSKVAGKITTTLRDLRGNPVSQAKVGVYRMPYSDNASQGFETSNGDGTVTVYATTTPVVIAYKIDNGTPTGSRLYGAASSLVTAIPVNVTPGRTVTLPTATLPKGGVLSGIVNVSGTAVGNYIVQVRSGSTDANGQFVNTRTRYDGSYRISLPAGHYHIRACLPSACRGTFSKISIRAGSNTWNVDL